MIQKGLVTLSDIALIGCSVKAMWQNTLNTSAEVWQHLKQDIVSYDQIQVLQNALNNLAMAWLALLIPVAIFLFDSVKKEGQSFGWDMHVLVTKILYAKTLCWATLMIFLPPFLFSTIFFDKDAGASNADLWIVVAALLLSIFGSGLYIKSLKNSYLWLSDFSNEDKEGFRKRKRLEYLQSIESIDEQVTVWSKTWAVKFDEPALELEFFEVYAKQLKKYQQPEDTKKFRELFEAFANHLTEKSKDENDIQSLIDGFSKVLNKQNGDKKNTQSQPQNLLNRVFWVITQFMEIVFDAFFILERQKLEPESNNVNEQEQLNRSQLEESISNCIKSLAELSFQNSRKGLADNFFKSMKKAIDKKENRNANTLDNNPINRLVQKVAGVLFNASLTHESDLDRIWHGFPKEWKVTNENMTNNNYVACCWYNAWLHEAIDTVSNAAFDFQNGEEVGLRKHESEKMTSNVLAKLFIAGLRFDQKVDPDWISFTRLFYAYVLKDIGEPEWLLKIPPILKSSVSWSSTNKNDTSPYQTLQNNAFQLAKSLFGDEWVNPMIKALKPQNIEGDAKNSAEKLMQAKERYTDLLTKYLSFAQ